VFQLFKQAAIVDSPDSVLVKKPFLIFAEGVEHLPLCETTKPAVIFPKHTQLKDGAYTLSCMSMSYIYCSSSLAPEEYLPSFEVIRLPVCFQQLLQLFARQGIRPGVGMLLEDLLKFFRNEPGG